MKASETELLAVPVPRSSEDDDAVYATISATVDGLRAYRRMSAQQLYAALGFSRATYYSRLAGETRWTAADVKRAADVLGVNVATLYTGLVAGAGFEPATSGSREPGAAVLPFPTGRGGARRYAPKTTGGALVIDLQAVRMATA